MGRQLKVDVVADARPFNNTLDAAVGKVTGFSSRLKAMGGGSLGKGLAIGAGVAGFNLLTSAIDVGISKLDEMHQAFLDDEASQARLQNVLKNTQTNWKEATAAVEAYAQAQLDMGFDDSATRDSIEQLAGVTKDYTEAIKLSSLAADIARAKNIDLATATDAVTRAANGSARGFIALGIDVQGATGSTQLLARAFQNVKGAQEAYAKTGAGAVATANVKMQETMEKVGKAIDVVSQTVIPIMVAGLGGIVDAAGEVIAGVQSLIAWFDQLITKLGEVADAATHASGPLGALLNIGRTVLSGIIPGQFGGAPQQGGTGSTGGITINRGINIGVPIHHSGGTVAGPFGSDQLIMAQAGERITPLGQSSGQVININIASFIGSDRDIDRFSDRLAFRLRSTSLS
jgi:hypothetical protein